MNLSQTMGLSLVVVFAIGVIFMANLFTYNQSEVTIQELSVSTTDQVLQQVHDFGGLTLQLPGAFAQLSADQAMALETEGYRIVEHNLVGLSAELPIMGGKTYKAMTFNGQVPGPTLRVTQGDIVKMTLCIPDDEVLPHSIDEHASQLSATNFGAVDIGTCQTYIYKAEYAGVFKFHCEGINLAAMDQHVLSGMYGIIIVDPLNGYRKLMVEKTTIENGEVKIDRKFHSADALEFQLHFSQLYLDENGNYDQQALFQHHASQNTVNGLALGYTPNEDLNELIMGDANKNIFVLQPWNSADLAQYQGKLMYVPTGQHVRLFVENQANEPLYFHLVGEIFDRVIQSNYVQAKGQDTHLIGGSQGVIIDLVFDEPGVYAAVNHDYGALFSGAAALFVAGDFFDLGISPSYAEALGNPSDAVPPMGKQSIAHPMINLHGLYTDERAAEVQEMIDNGKWQTVQSQD